MHPNRPSPPRPQALETAIRGALVGLAATAGDLLALVALVALGAPLRIASLPALAVGVAVQFVGSKLFTFEDPHGARSRWVKQGALFLVVEVAALALNLVVFDAGLRLLPVPYPALRILSTSLVYFAFSLPLWSLVFRTHRPKGSAA